MAENAQILAMRKLGMTEEEIKQVLEDDKAIDHGEKMDFDLSDEKAKEAKKYTRTGTRKTVYNFNKRKRKENATKGGIITALAKFLTENEDTACENVQIANAERLITFKCGENLYDLTLIQKRKPKN